MFKDGIIQCNSLGVSFISDDIPKKKAQKVNDFMDKLIEKYEQMAQDEFDKFLNQNNLETCMGVIIKKHKS